MKSAPKPRIFSAADLNQLKKLKINHPNLTIIDQYQDQLHELFKSRHPKHANDPKKRARFIANLLHSEKPHHTGNWVYFPWKNTAVHILEEPLFQEVRLSRNHPLISKEDQQKFLGLTIGIVGLSVGSSVLQAIVHSGGGNQLKLADFDTLSLSNLNRIRASLTDLGENKTHIAAKQVYEINPYAQITFYDQGITPENLKEFFLKDPPIDLVIDEADDLATKQFLRLAAQSQKIPLLMTTDNGFESNTSVLRFDLNQTTPELAEYKDKSLDEIVAEFKSFKPPQLTEKEKLQQIANLLGPENICPQMQKGAMLRAQEQIAGWPQLAMTVFLGGGMAAFASLLIASKKLTLPHQSSFSLPSHLNPDYHTSESKQARQEHTQRFIEFLNSL